MATYSMFDTRWPLSQSPYLTYLMILLNKTNNPR